MAITKVYRKDLKAWRYKINVTISGKRIRRAEFLTRQEAKDVVAQMQTEARAARYGLVVEQPKITLDQLYEKVKKDLEKKATRTAHEAIRVIGEFIKTIGEKTPLTSLTRSDWKRYTDSLKSRSVKNKTINRYLSDISNALRSAPLYFSELENWQPPKALWEKDGPGRDRVLSQQEIAQILHALSLPRWRFEKDKGPVYRPEIADILRLMLLTGAREGEIFHLQQSQVSWDFKAVQIVSKKGGGSKRVVPLSDTALEILRSRKHHAPRFFRSFPYVSIPHTLAGSDPYTQLAYGNNISGGWVLYDARHTAGTVLESSGIPYSAVSLILGHKRRDQTATYTHAQPDALKRAVQILESWCREIDWFDGKSMDSRVTREILK